MKYGYARVSSSGQDLTIQIEALSKAGCETIRQEKVSGTSVQGRDELNTLLEFLRKGDELVVTRIDRLARSIRDLQNIVFDLDKKGVVLSATEQPIDTRTSAGKCFLDMLGSAHRNDHGSYSRHVSLFMLGICECQLPIASIDLFLFLSRVFCVRA